MLKSAFSSPKIRTLAVRLGIPFPHACGLCGMLWNFTADHAPAGDVGKHTDEQIAVALEWPGDAAELIANLVYVRLVDRHDKFRLVIHDWPDHCPQYVLARLAKMKMKFAVPPKSSTSDRSSVRTRRRTSDATLVRTSEGTTSTSTSPPTSTHTPSSPPSPSSRGRPKPGSSHPQATLGTEMGASPDGMRMEMDEIRKAVDGDITDCPRKAFLIRSVVSQCHPKTQVKLMRTIIGWPPGEWIYRAYEGWKKGAESAANKPAYFAKCILNAEPPTAAGGRR